MAPPIERSLFGFIFRYSKRDQFLIVPLVVASMAVYYLTLDLPKRIINEPIQGKSFPGPDSTAPFLQFVFKLPEFFGYGGQTIRLFDGIQLEQLWYLLALTLSFLALIVLNGFIKFRINTMKGWMGERMLRRLRFALFDHVLRFPLLRFRRVKAAEISSMIKDEVEPLGGFIGEAMITPLYLIGEAGTALAFIVYQHWALGMIAVGMVAMQVGIMPRLRRRLLVLAKERQLTARQLAGRVAESVDGIVEIRAHDTSNYERAEISSRLGRIFRIRFEFYQRKFLIKFLNNLLSQVTPFLFYTVGGYLVIVGKLDIGALVAVIAAYKDLPSPIKELIDWDQQRLDVQIKYTQVIEQFTVDDLAPPEMQQVLDAPLLPSEGRIRVSNLSLVDEAGEKVVDSVSFEVDLETHVGVVGLQGAGRSELAQLLARLVPPSGGSVEIGGVDITRAPEAVTGRAISYVGSSAYLFPVSVRENLLYGLKHRPVGEVVYEGDALREHEFQQREARRTGGCLLDYNAEWIDYASAGAANPQELEARVLEVLKVVDLEELIFEFGLKSGADVAKAVELRDKLLGARAAMHDRLAAAGTQGWVERFEPAHYNRNATLAENLLFGAPVGKTFDVENLARNAYVRRVLEETALTADLVRIGFKVAETMVELFSGLPPGHEFFEQYSFIRHEDLPGFKEILSRAVESDLGSLGETDRDQLLALPFKLIQAKHRLGLIDEALEERIVEARRYFASHLPENLKGSVEFFDPNKYNIAASLLDNILFGKVVTAQAQAVARVGALVRQVLDDLGLRPLVVTIGLDYQVGVAGARLPPPERQKVALARAMLKRPVALILDRVVAVLDPVAQVRILTRILEYRKGRSVIWVLENNDLAERFEHVLVMEHGRLAERGSVAELKQRGGALQMLLAGG